jgi:vancomycin resistance protein VanJ
MTATENTPLDQNLSTTPTRKPFWWRLGFTLYRLSIIPVMAYGVGMTLLLVLRWVIGEQWVVIAYLNNFLQLMLAPAPILLIISLVLRRRNLALSLVLPTVYLVLFYAVFFLPRSAPQVPADAPRLTILTYNLKADNWFVDHLLRVIREADTDVVAMQELIPQAAELFEKELADQYPYQAFHINPENPYEGQGILSRYPIVADEYWTIHRGHQRVELDVNGERIILCNTHPIQPLSTSDGLQMRHEEIQAVLTRATAETGRVLLMGDFNLPDQAEDYGRITTHFRDTWREVGSRLGHTFPTRGTRIMGIRIMRPFFRLDYIFLSDHFQALSARVWPDRGRSDHYPLYAELALID